MFHLTKHVPQDICDNINLVDACLLSLFQQFLQVFPELRAAPLFLTGESYAGKYLPAFGHYINHNKNDSIPINLKNAKYSFEKLMRVATGINVYNYLKDLDDESSLDTPTRRRSLAHDMYDIVKSWLEELLEHYEVMCYKSLNWSGAKGYLNAVRKPLYDEENGLHVNSFVKESGNIMDVMVRNAGHMVPTDEPRAAKQIIDVFINKFK